MHAADDQDLNQTDLSHLRLQEMTPDQRAELRRRYDRFVRHFGRAGAPHARAAAAPRPRKWRPGEKG
ncbi:MAG TPA: hypothetical protein VET85_10090 [Stellaceae bacterium]|nr:hypothetical protein [Stellaceae bacterium]